MIEAQILCNTPVSIPDLRLDLCRGEEIWIDASLARNSNDLRKALAVGKVKVYYRVRDRKKIRSHAPPVYQRLRPTPRVVTEEKIVIEKPDMTALAAEIKKELLGDLKGTIAEEIAKALAAQPKPETPEIPETTPEVSVETMAKVMEGVLKRHMPTQTGVAVASSGRSRPEKSADDEAPLYMPEGIVDLGAKAAISVQTKTTEGGDELDENAKLLREMRRKRKTDGDK